MFSSISEVIQKATLSLLTLTPGLNDSLIAFNHWKQKTIASTIVARTTKTTMSW